MKVQNATGGESHIRKNVSLNRTIVLAMVVLYGILLVLLTCMDLFLIGSYQRNRRREEEALLNRYAEQLGDGMRETGTILRGIYVNNNYFNALGGALSELEEFNQVYELDYELRNRIEVEGMPHGYIIYYHSNEKIRYYVNQSLIDTKDIRQLTELCKTQLDAGSGRWQWRFADIGGNRYGILVEKRDRAAMCMVYGLKQTESSLETDLGNESGGSVFFADDGGVFGCTAEELYENIRKQELKSYENHFQGTYAGNYIYARKVNNTGLWICVAIPVTLWSFMNVPQLILLFLTVSSLFGMYLLYRYARRELILPLREMIGVMKRIQDGDWDAHPDRETRFEELQKVNTAMSVMVSEIKKQKLLFYEQTIEKQKAQMQYLQLQLKPHFYLNGLKTLQALVMRGDSERMQDLIINLSWHLRYLLQAEKELVPLAAELEYVKNYARLQVAMTGRLLDLDWKVQEQMRGWLVPTLCIQTFVENSFKYAKVGSVERRLVIWITVNELETEDGCFLDICIRDNGGGYPAQVLEEINDEPAEDCVSVGINNLKRRCRLLYGDLVQYGFYNESGAVSDLVLPWRKTDGKAGK